MSEMFVVVALGFFLGMRHATDADHVVAVTTIVARQRDIGTAALTGLLWGVGHTLTVLCVGSAIILFNIAIPDRIGIGMELSVGVMLVVLGALNVAAYTRFRPRSWRHAFRRSTHARAHPHRHGDYIHSHPHVAPDHHPHPDDQTPLASLDRRLGRSRTYRLMRPVVVGVVHGLAGSAAVTLLVVAAVRDPRWAIAYLLVFGVGTIAGMILITMTIASALHLVGGGSELVARRLAIAFGLASVFFGVSFAYHVWSAGISATG